MDPPPPPLTPKKQRKPRTSSSSTHLRQLAQSPQLRSRLASLSLTANKKNKHAASADNIVILEIGNRIVRAGVAGRNTPACEIHVESVWSDLPQMKNYQNSHLYASLWSIREISGEKHWQDGTENEPWYIKDPIKRMESVLEAILRQAFNEELLVDPRTQRIAIVENPFWPNQIRKSIVKVLFKHLHVLSVVFIPSPVLDLIAAGLRSGIVVDIGWEETTVHPVYDLRHLITESRSSVRGSKLLFDETKELLQNALNSQVSGQEVTFNDTQKAVAGALYAGTDNPVGAAVRMVVPGSSNTPPIAKTRTFELQCGTTLQVSNKVLQSAVTSTLLSSSPNPDDNELSIPLLISNVIEHLSHDVRGTTQSTIVFVGSATRIPGLQSKILSELRRILRKKDITSASSVMAAKSLGAWTGASLYMASLSWYFAQDDRIVLPGEMSRERYTVLGYDKLTPPFGLI